MSKANPKYLTLREQELLKMAWGEHPYTEGKFWDGDDVNELLSTIGRLRHALIFARSVIQSGEEWTATCETVIGVECAR